ncbi:rod shape-determining protein MreC [Gangjinia marincola]|uniref:Cell shape-determining protein MreC n=1 Tax=Gangjinia marincola TaxID=578463 RepID=A0ABN1MGV5_9FLAO
MQQIIDFLIRYRNAVVYLLLLSLALFFTIQAHSYHQSKVISSTNSLTGGLLSWSNNLGDYFDLKDQNELLLNENKRLRNQLSASKEKIKRITVTDSIPVDTTYRYRSAQVIANNYSLRDNYITLDKGNENGFSKDMGIISSKGIVGVVEDASERYSRVISILNSNLEINVGLKKSSHYGSMSWNGKDPNTIQLTDINRLAPVAKGDTIITAGKSLIFPKGIPVGTIKDYTLDQSQTYFLIEIRLFNDMTNLDQVYAIEHLKKEEIRSLEEPESKLNQQPIDE